MLQASSLCSPERNLHRDRCFDRWVRVVTEEFEIFEPEILDVFDRRIQFHPRQRPEISRELFARLFEMVVVKMQIAKGVDEIARHEVGDLSYHHREQCVACDVERNTEEKIAAALVKLAA